MKKLIKYFGVVVAAAAILSGCSKALDNKEVEENVSRITCTLPDDGTKTYADGLKVKWAEGDVLYVSSQTNEAKTYTLESGAGSTKATFVGTGIEKGANITACHFKNYAWASVGYGPKWYYDIPNELSLSDCLSGNSEANKMIPMIATGVMGDAGTPTVLNLQHLQSMVRVKVVNNTGEALTISSIIISCSDKMPAGRLSIEDVETATSARYNAKQYPISATGENVIPVSESRTFDFVMIADTYGQINVRITDNEGQNYFFRKANFTAEQGVLHNFTANATEPNDAMFNVIINGLSANPKPWNPGDPIPGLSDAGTNSIAIVPGTESVLSDIQMNILATAFKKQKNKVISLDLSGIDYASTSYSSNAFQSSTYLSDFYFPKNITKTNGYSLFWKCVNAKLHISKDMNGDIDYILFGDPMQDQVLKAGCGIFVDAENPVYYSEDGVLYAKSDDNKYYTLWQKPVFENEGVYTVNENVHVLHRYAISNNRFITTLICPASLETIKQDNLYKTPALSKIVFKGATPPSFGSNFTPGTGTRGTETGVIEIDTGTDAGDDAAIQLYYASLNGKLGAGWVLKTKAGKVVDGEGHLSPLNKGTSYPNIW